MTKKALVGLLFTIMGAAQVSALAAPAVFCPVNGTGGDGLDRGFYVENFTAGSIATVTLTYFTGGVAGSYTITLTMHDGAYNGIVLGTQTVTTSLAASGGTATTFDFGNVAIPTGDTVAFVQTLVSGPSTMVYFDTGTCGLGDTACTSCPGVIETEATNPLLDTFRRGSVGVTIDPGAQSAIPAIGASGLVLFALVLLSAGLLVLRKFSG